MAPRHGPASPLSPASARRVLDYDRAVFERFARQLRRLPKKEAFRDRGIGHRSLFRTLVHILNVREAWFDLVVRDGGRNEAAFLARPERNPADWRGFGTYAHEVWAGHARLRATLSARELARPVRAFWMPGRYAVGDAILQASYEEAHHLGEIIGALWVDDRATSGMTWIEVHREAAARRR